MTYAVLFPGQGSQSVGMCADVRAERPDLFARASEILGWDLEAAIADGPEEALTATERAQPALFVTSYVLWEEFSNSVDGGPAAVAGHSLGEYTALAASGALSFDDGVALVAERGLAMAEAAASQSSSMAALIGADEDTAEAIASGRRDDGGQLYVANLNAPGQIVVAGGTADIEWLAQNARDLGVRRAIPLAVAGAFHSPFMASARARLDAALEQTEFDEPRIPVIANATAQVMDDPRVALSEQLTSPVRFAASLVFLAEAGCRTFVHVGPGDVTAGLAKRSVEDAEAHVASDLVGARHVAEALSLQ